MDFPAGGGMEKGEKVLDILASHPNTAKFLCKKLVSFFTNDNPSEPLINRVVDTYESTNGEIKSLLTTLVELKEFWQEVKVRIKIKTPFEYVISSIRILETNVENPNNLYFKIKEMGQEMY
ncbi:MAG: DUF1800 family protein [Chlorobiota bacterium]|jgi:uncharacterized protein (DUF1800 family)|nr:DUF1800 family protein [Chlorobiota bacterium]QQS67770.1 MAG: DUF1800 family protein [Chlorobiota bacterium]